MANFTIGIDLGMIADYSALAVTERLVAAKEVPFNDGKDIQEDSHYHVRHIKRWDLGTPYPVIIRETGELIRKARLQDAAIILDGTGVGRDVVKLFQVAYQRQLLGHNWPRGYVITAGRKATNTEVPKRDLVSKMQALLQTGRLKVGQMPEATLLRQELMHFRAKVSPTGVETYESARERDHDDIVLAVALSCWFKHYLTEPRFIDGTRIDEKASLA